MARRSRLLTAEWRFRRAPNHIKFAADGRRLMTAAGDRVLVWTVPGLDPVGNPLAVAPHVALADLSTDGTLVLAAAGARGEVGVYDAGSDRPRWTARRPRGFAVAAFSPDGKQVMLLGEDEAVIRFADARTGKELLAISDRGTKRILRAGYSPDGTRVWARCGLLGRTKTWWARTGELISALDHGGNNEAAFSPDGETFVQNTTGNVTLSRVRTGERIAATEFEDRSDSQVMNIAAVAFAPDGRTFATSGEDTARVWRADTCAPVTPRIPCEGVTFLSFSPGGRWLATGSWYEGRVWDSATGRIAHGLRDARGHNPPGRAEYDVAVAFSPAGPFLAINFADTVELWTYPEDRPAERSR